MNKKILIIMCTITLIVIICLYIILFVFSGVIVERELPHIVGELEVYDINKANDSITFKIIITRIQPPDSEAGIYSDGVYDENLHDPDISKRRYTLWLFNNTTFIKNPAHKYIDVQNDYKINTDDFIIIYNMSKYFGSRILLDVKGLGGRLEGEIPADPNVPVVAQWVGRGISCREWFVKYMSLEKNYIDFDWETYHSDYIPYAGRRYIENLPISMDVNKNSRSHLC